MKTVIQTPRLFLTRISHEDAADIRRLAGDAAVARDALNIPHPFEVGAAEAWIDSLKPDDAVFAIRTSESGPLTGLIGLIYDSEHNTAELSYWIGCDYWGNGYATEAAQSVVAFGFEDMTLNRIFATRFARNSASGRVLEKIGFRVEGCLRKHVKHWGIYEDLLFHGLLRKEYTH